MSETYANPWRPNYEARVCLLWLGVAAFAWGTVDLWRLHAGAFHWLAILALVMALIWLPSALSLASRHGWLRGHPLGFIAPADFTARMPGWVGDLWLGWGFDWLPAHTQLALDLMRAGPERFARRQPKSMGATWLHGLGGRDRDVRVPLEHIEGHLLVVGTTGAGKTRLFDLLVTQAVLRGEAVVIIDPKGDQDLRHTAQRACALAGIPGRFVSFHPAFPGESVRIDPLHSFNRATELASRIAALIPSETGNDPFKAFGQMALSNVVQGLLAVDERPSLVSLRHYLEGGAEALVERALRRYFTDCRPGWEDQADGLLARARTGDARVKALVRFYRERVSPEHPSTVMDGLIGLFEHEQVHFSKMIASLMPILNMLTAGDLQGLLSPDAATPADGRRLASMAGVIAAGEVLYVGLDALSDTMVGSAIGSILIADLAAVAGDRYNHQGRPSPVNVFIDEAAEVVNDPFIQLLNKGRGAGLRLTIATQTFADFAARTGSEAKARQVLGNINNLIALRVLDAETQEYVAESLPKARVVTIMRAHGSTTDSTNPVLYTGNTGERLVEEEVERFAPALLGQLPNFEYVAKLSGGRIVKGRLPILGAPRAPRSAPAQ
ncbi:conjugative transfer system coupling protein TraD [uncultured Lamprocystis sp.]|jgi:conjugal transfer pilus assembly protein TraD|uniref:conjugative transfer system coupling protein TraD n=1 Tax=uncultured Lamprocystis sp. TaxID=543132 RepID=UPI0025DDFDE2|nr:conjugative transfer system coupling protein TraD [uncultured Lamprocystis sp.]